MGKMSDCVWRRIHVKRRVWAEAKAEAVRRDENVSDLADPNEFRRIRDEIEENYHEIAMAVFEAVR